MPPVEPVTELQVQRILCAIYSTWWEDLLDHVVTVCYAHSYDKRWAQTGKVHMRPVAWIGDRADDLRSWSQNTRAKRKVARRNGRG